MSNKQLMLTLAKVLIAAAWADGEISHDEVNSVKDLLFHLPRMMGQQPIEITSTDWNTLKLYAEAPVSPAERARLVEELRLALQAPQDKQMALTALENLMQADGSTTDAEQAILAEIKAALDTVDQPDKFMSKVSRLIRGPVQRRNEAVANAPNREIYLEDYLKNKVYLKVKYRLHLEGGELGIPDDQLRKLSLAGGLMSRVASVDDQVVEAEFEQIVKVLQADWNISSQAATLVAEVAVSEISPTMDFYRMAREFFEQTTEAERVRFLDVLLDVAAADGAISSEEQAEVGSISTSLMIHQPQYTAALRKAHETPR